MVDSNEEREEVIEACMEMLHQDYDVRSAAVVVVVCVCVCVRVCVWTRDRALTPHPPSHLTRPHTSRALTPHAPLHLTRPCTSRALAPHAPLHLTRPYTSLIRKVGDIIANKLIPNAVLFFTGEIWDYESDGEEEEEEDMEGDDLDDDDDDDVRLASAGGEQRANGLNGQTRGRGQTWPGTGLSHAARGAARPPFGRSLVRAR